MLGYFDLRGLGAPCRYMLHYCKVDFEDRMYTIGPPPEYDNSHWLDVKFKLGLDLPNLPYFIDKDINLTETRAIMQYIAHKWRPELLPRTSKEVGQSEMIFDYIKQLTMAVVAVYSKTDLKEITDGFWPILDKIVAFQKKKPFLSGDNLMWIDFLYFEFLCMGNYFSGGKLFKKYPVCKAYY